MIIVILVLMALLVLCTPFLMTVRNADKASTQNANLMAGRLALESAAKHARASLRASHPALDGTPYFDSLDELEVTNLFADGFLDASDPSGVMWDLDVRDVSGLVDLNSAPPQMIGNLLGVATRLAGGVEAEETEISLVSVASFLPEGFVFVGAELIGYTGIEGHDLTGAVRGLGVELDDEGNPLPCGLRPPAGYPSSVLVIDQRAWALCNWRIFTPDGELKPFDSIEQVREAQELVMAGTLGPEALNILQRSATVYSGVQGGAVWQRPTRLVTAVVGAMTSSIQVADARWFNAGTTIQITDGLTTELALVRSTNGNSLSLVDCLVNDYEGYAAVVRSLARRPVNVNTAPREVLEALFLNLQLVRRQAMITAHEAELLADVVIESRPFTGFEDFVRRVILPAGGFEPLPADAPLIPEVFAVDELVGAGEQGFSPIIDKDDARALYKNARNANDGELLWSTMPFAFVSTDVHQMELRASVNAPSGVERVSAVREQVELITPGRDLMQVWTRQEDFDRSFRFDRDARGWMSGPHATTRYDPIFGSDPPTRSRPNLGPRDTMPTFDPLSDQTVYTFASRGDDGWIQLGPSRVEEIDALVGHMLHFDHESRDPEGRYLPDGTVNLDTGDGLVGWRSGGDLLRPLSFSGWFQPRALEDGTWFLDVGGSYVDADRISLLIDGGDLVLRVLDGAGDHPETAFEEVAEVRYTLAAGESPGLPIDTWTHFSLDVRGNRPDQMTLLSDGRWHTRTKGLTALTGSIGSEVGSIPVESTEGFPSPCVLRIGDELIEATVTSGTSFEALFQETGSQAGYGGRGARVKFTGPEIGIPQDLTTTAGFHASGTPVMLYGYSLPLASNIPPGETQLTSELGIFAVGRVVQTADSLEQIVITLADGTSFDLGTGLDLEVPVTLELAPADPSMDIGTVMSAFSRSGGYAALVTWNYNLRITNDAGITEPVTTINGTRMGGVEVVHYSSWDGTQITIDRRGDNVGELTNLAEADPDMKGKGAFVFDWNDSLVIF
ncbi:MAG: type II secretion system protein GspK, partial [Planctomycetota bacterium]|nr:type II secretion system protein GspK [Planctomycetota bacterium]